MAHSLFEPAPEPLSEKLWRRMKDLSRSAVALPAHSSVAQTDPALLSQADQLDARGRQQLLEAVLTTKPIKK
ncbi:hypothetical protein [Roseibium sediminicola]|uniref:Uncharacterized protein n=1 Tax=Roseibium sediminicola TaxID=2933272 RepID=A0ABT0H0M2_9HYPH|nr:hypothetical protein [Roseibium sp. CAU 1639]MCK7615245.1 hypothetical protein [Roseibium sp. CAU 1639]